MQYAIVYNPNQLTMIALSSTEVLNDLAYDKGWRVLDQDVNYLRLQEYKDKFEMEVMEPAQFYMDYLVDEEMSEEDSLYIEACMQENFYEEVHADPDEEEFDESFSSEDTEETLEEA